MKTEAEKLAIANVLEFMLVNGHYAGGYMCINICDVYRAGDLNADVTDLTTNYIEGRIAPYSVLSKHLYKTREFGIRFSFNDTHSVQRIKRTFWYLQVINELRGLPVAKWESRWTTFKRWLKSPFVRDTNAD